MANGTSGTRSVAKNNAGTAPELAAVNDLPQMGYINGEPLWDEDGVEWIQQNLHITKQQAEIYQDAVAHFTGANYEEIRAAQQSGTANKHGQRGAALEDYISAAPQWDNSQELYRGVALDQSTVNGISKALKSKKPFDVNHGATASWTTDNELAEAYSNEPGKIPVVFKSKKTRNATPVMHLSSVGDESEVIVSKKNKYRPTKITKTKLAGKDGYIIEVEQL